MGMVRVGYARRLHRWLDQRYVVMTGISPLRTIYGAKVVVFNHL